MTYQNPMLVDDGDAREFLDLVVEQLIEDQVYLCWLMFRKKYGDDPKVKDLVAVQEIFKKTDWNYVKSKLDGMVAKAGTYDRDLNTAVLYWDILPKSMILAKGAVQSEDNNLVYNRKWDEFRHEERRLWSALTKSPCHHVIADDDVAVQNRYIVVDIDRKDAELMVSVCDNVGIKHVRWISETRGGYHVIFNKNTESRANLYTHVMRNSQFDRDWDLKKDDLAVLSPQQGTPIPGFVQGDFAVKRVKI